jgi:hypothetical protein
MAAVEGCFAMMRQQSYLLQSQTERDAKRDKSHENLQNAQVEMMRDMMKNWQETMTNMMGMMTGMVEKLAMQNMMAPVPAASGATSPLRFFAPSQNSVAPAQIVSKNLEKAPAKNDPPLIKLVRDDRTGKLKRLKENA